ncbi:MAG: flagellar hook protein FlgE [Rhodospirillales bacterium]
MTGFGLFQSSVLGMQSQSRALSVIGGNVANVNTTAYKRAESQFATLFSDAFAGTADADGGPLSSPSDMGGVVTHVVTRVGDQGELSTTGRDLDAAIDGNGFFVLADADGNRLYGRNGRFGEVLGPAISVGNADDSAIATNTRYLADGNGNVLQGWRVAPDGTSAGDAASLAPVRTDAYAFTSDVLPTSKAHLALNLPAGASVGASESLDVQVYDSTGTARSLTARFTKTAANGWQVELSDADGGRVSLDPAGSLSFDADGTLAGPASFRVAVDHGGGAASAFTLDFADTTQLSGNFTVDEVTADGHAAGVLDSVSFDGEGYVVGAFSNGTSRRIWRLPIADFANPEGLLSLSGNVYAPGADSGAPVLDAAGTNGAGSLKPGVIELSNVDLADQFSRMIQTQNAYNSSATAFRTLDEVMETARDLKR